LVGVTITLVSSFASNSLEHTDLSGGNHQKFADGLKKALFNYMHNNMLEVPLDFWFGFPIPKIIHHPDLVEELMNDLPSASSFKKDCRLLWLNSLPEYESYEYQKKGKAIQKKKILFSNRKGKFSISFKPEIGDWLQTNFPRFLLDTPFPISFGELSEDFEKQTSEKAFVFFQSKEWEAFHKNGLLLI